MCCGRGHRVCSEIVKAYTDDRQTVPPPISIQFHLPTGGGCSDLTLCHSTASPAGTDDMPKAASGAWWVGNLMSGSAHVCLGFWSKDLTMFHQDSQDTSEE